jgi:hypothetical protein
MQLSLCCFSVRFVTASVERYLRRRSDGLFHLLSSMDLDDEAQVSALASAATPRDDENSSLYQYVGASSIFCTAHFWHQDLIYAMV